MTRLPLRCAAATALALLALACERVETKSLLTDLDRLENVESADADPDELATDTFDPEPDTGDRIDIEPDTNDIVADADDTADTIEPDIADTADQDHLTDDDEESEALPPGCRDDQPVYGCPCVGTAVQKTYGNVLCDPVMGSTRYTSGFWFECRSDGRWRLVFRGPEVTDPHPCSAERCIGYRIVTRNATGGVVGEGRPCDGGHPSQSPPVPAPECRGTPCVCAADGTCIPREAYEGDVDLDQDFNERSEDGFDFLPPEGWTPSE